MTLVLMIFLMAGLALGATFLVLKDWWSPAGTRGLRQRFDEEFPDRKEAAAPSAIFKNLAASAPAGGKKDLAVRQARGRLADRLREMLDQAGVPLSLVQMLLLTAALGIAVGAPLAWFRGPLLGLAGAAAGFALPGSLVWLRLKSRQERMLKQLPGVFDLLARVIRAGQSVPQALQAVSDSFDGPLADEFSRCQKQMQLGLAHERAFPELAERTDILEVRIFVMALLIQRQVGGSLAETMERLSAMVRSRLQLRKQVRTLTAEGRLQGWTLVVLPFVIFAAMMAINRPYAEILLSQGKLLAAAIVSMICGILWIRKIVNFDT